MAPAWVLKRAMTTPYDDAPNESAGLAGVSAASAAESRGEEESARIESSVLGIVPAAVLVLRRRIAAGSSRPASGRAANQTPSAASAAARITPAAAAVGDTGNRRHQGRGRSAKVVGAGCST